MQNWVAEPDVEAGEPRKESAVAMMRNSKHLPVAVRLNTHGGQGISGKCRRNMLTGKAVLHGALSTSDFCIVDLWERTAIYGDPEDLINDPYLFKVVPLPMRTWFYHTLFSSGGEVAKSSGDNGIMETVLKLRAVDADKPSGSWSPVIMSVPVAFVCIIAADYATAFACVIMVAFNLAVSAALNSPRYFGYVRSVTALPRIGFFFFMLAQMISLASEGGSTIYLCFLIILFILLVDFYQGDIQSLKAIGLHCHYEIMKALPNRMFVCRRTGAAFLQEQDGSQPISQVVTGMHHFPELALIIERGGLIFQLKPTVRQDWVRAWEIQADTGRPISFIGMDVFNRDRKSVYAMEMEKMMQTEEGARDAMLASPGRKKAEQPAAAAPGEIKFSKELLE